MSNLYAVSDATISAGQKFTPSNGGVVGTDQDGSPAKIMHPSTVGASPVPTAVVTGLGSTLTVSKMGSGVYALPWTTLSISQSAMIPDGQVFSIDSGGDLLIDGAAAPASEVVVSTAVIVASRFLSLLFRFAKAFTFCRAQSSVQGRQQHCQMARSSILIVMANSLLAFPPYPSPSYHLCQQPRCSIHSAMAGPVRQAVRLYSTALQHCCSHRLATWFASAACYRLPVLVFQLLIVAHVLLCSLPLPPQVWAGTPRAGFFQQGLCRLLPAYRQIQ
ncbi:hypothetical protein K431DRAFT_80921 [Polychaeton citri CBS 116435]|uniref:Uncharacterized protein n=1 Tax=Polychaeton citri CBS 116435 TaxID=1314669 RepID=A0A9P4QHE9_9PEZI|nr:hypothetical protein K431DRAFT_80921 [Polychaeton citri CBS 116435]